MNPRVENKVNILSETVTLILKINICLILTASVNLWLLYLLH
jgi:hypothetical protein